MKGLCKAVTEEAFNFFKFIYLFTSQPQLTRHPPLPGLPPFPPSCFHPPILSPSRKGKVSLNRHQ